MIDKINNVDLIVSDSFGMWITGLWGNIYYQNPSLNFLEQKIVFFELVKKLLDEGRLKFIKPGTDVYYNATLNPSPKYTINDIESHWELSSDEIIEFLASEWPKAASHRNDKYLNVYFHQIPAVIWKDENGQWHGS